MRNRREEDYRAALARHSPWRPKIRYVKRRILWYGYWKGPLGGAHTAIALTRNGVRQAVKSEIAQWTRKLRKIRSRARGTEVLGNDRS